MGKTSRKQISPKRFATAMVRGATIEEAALRAGYSLTSARRGKSGVSTKCWEEYETALKQKVNQLADVGASLTAEHQQNLVRGKLVQNVAEGKDEAAQSLKLLGQDKRVNMFAPENSGQYFILEAPKLPPLPPGFMEKFEKEEAEYRKQKALKESGISYE